jgi:hypothetical protein
MIPPMIWIQEVMLGKTTQPGNDHGATLSNGSGGIYD